MSWTTIADSKAGPFNLVGAKDGEVLHLPSLTSSRLSPPSSNDRKVDRAQAGPCHLESGRMARLLLTWGLPWFLTVGLRCFDAMFLRLWQDRDHGSCLGLFAPHRRSARTSSQPMRGFCRRQRLRLPEPAPVVAVTASGPSGMANFNFTRQSPYQVKIWDAAKPCRIWLPSSRSCAPAAVRGVSRLRSSSRGGYGAAGERANTRRRRREATLTLCSVDMLSTHPPFSKAWTAGQ